MGQRNADVKLALHLLPFCRGLVLARRRGVGAGPKALTSFAIGLRCTRKKRQIEAAELALQLMSEQMKLGNHVVQRLGQQRLSAIVHRFECWIHVLHSLDEVF